MGKRLDLTINVIIPILIGIVLYFVPVSLLIRNHIPDGLWAYSLTSLILIIWDRNYPILWLSLIFLLFLLFEWLQYQSIIYGTGDLIDTAFYLVFFLFALIINKMFKHKYNYES